MSPNLWQKATRWWRAHSIKALAAGRESELHAVGAGIIGLSDPGFIDFAAAHAQTETLRSAFSGFFRNMTSC